MSRIAFIWEKFFYTMKKILFTLALLFCISAANAQTDSTQYIAVTRIANRIVIDKGDGKLWQKVNEIYPDIEVKAESDIEMLVRLKKKGWDFVAVLPEQKSYSGNWTPILLKKK
jgi:hypothetical protein